MVKPGSFQGESINKLGPNDIRFTRNKSNSVVYAMVLGWPSEPIVIRSLGLSSSAQPGKVNRVELLGTGEKASWKQDAEGLRVELPRQYRPAVDYAAALKVILE